ncbi:MAG: glycosyltransferase family 4 protein [Acidimicrobiales bacterium]
MSRHIAALVPNVLASAPGQRARIELWASHLEAAGWTIEFHTFEDPPLHEVLYSSGRAGTKAARLLSCYGRHLATVARRASGDVTFVYREAAMVGPALAERLVARRPSPLVYDLDDPTWLPYRSPTNGWMSLLKFPAKTRSLFRMSDRVIAINHAIADYAARFNPAVTVIPNCIDTDRYQPRSTPSDPPVRVVWIGSHSTAANLATIAGPLHALQATQPVVFRVIGAGEVPLPGVDVEWKGWSPAHEVELLTDCHIGVVPLNDLSWNPWKFFFKTIQYMAVGLPVVARRMGSNPEVVEDGVNGFLVDDDDEWLDRLQVLTTDAELRRRMGKAARETVVERFSVRAQMPRVVSTFEDVLRRTISAA